jgi:hypothetical protein
MNMDTNVVVSQHYKHSLIFIRDNFRVLSSLGFCLPHYYCLRNLCLCLWSFSYLNFYKYIFQTDDFLPCAQVCFKQRPKCSRGGPVGAASGSASYVRFGTCYIHNSCLILHVSEMRCMAISVFGPKKNFMRV